MTSTASCSAAPVVALGRVDSTSVHRGVIAAMGAADSQLREAAVEALSEISHPNAGCDDPQLGLDVTPESGLASGQEALKIAPLGLRAGVECLSVSAKGGNTT